MSQYVTRIFSIICLIYVSGCMQGASVSPIERASLDDDPFKVDTPKFSSNDLIDGEGDEDVAGVNDKLDSAPPSSPLSNESRVKSCDEPGRFEKEKNLALEEALADETGYTIPVKYSYSFGDKHDLLAKFAHDRAILSKSNPGVSYIPVGQRNSHMHKNSKGRKQHFHYIANHDKAKEEYSKGERCFFSTIKVDPAHQEGVVSSPKYDFIDVTEEDFYKLEVQASKSWLSGKGRSKTLWAKHLIHYMYYGYCNNRACNTNGDKFEGEYANRLFDALPIERENPQIIKLYVADLRSEQIGVDKILLTESKRQRGVEQTKSVKEMLNLCKLNENLNEISNNLSKEITVDEVVFSPTEQSNQVLHNLINLDGEGTTISTQYTPIVIDLGEKGIRTSSAKFGTYFNIAGLINKETESLKVPHKTAWLGGVVSDVSSSSSSDSERATASVNSHYQLIADDGFLVIPNEDSSVESAFNLFGDKIAIDGISYENGFVALQKLNSKICDSENVRDRYFGPWDEKFEDLVKVWVDRNRNGKADEKEVISLEEAGVLAINTCNIVHAQAEDGFGNGTKLRSALLIQSANEKREDITEEEIIQRLATGYRSNDEKADFRVAIDVYFDADKTRKCQFNVDAEEVEVVREEKSDKSDDKSDDKSEEKKDVASDDEEAQVTSRAPASDDSGVGPTL